MHQSQNPKPISETPGTTGIQRSERPKDVGVLLAATELFAGREQHSIENKKIFVELARNLLPSTSLGDRRRISNLLSVHPDIPASLQAQLATDTDELTAYAALRYSSGLSVDLLLKTAKLGSDTLRKAVANRSELDDSIISMLCKHGGASVVQIILDRDDLVLNDKQQATLSRRNDILSTIGLQLDGQSALNPDGLMGQYLHLPAPLKSKAIATAEMTHLIKQAQVPGSKRQARLNTDRLQLQDALTKAALQKDILGFADLLSLGLGLSKNLCDLLLHADQADGLTIALKSLGMNAENTAKIMIRFFGETMQLSAIRSFLRLHRNLSAGAADVLVGQWILNLGASEGLKTDQQAKLASQFQDSIRQPSSPTQANTSSDQRRIKGQMNGT
ncbi:MAG: DUF2336 domain-containing protein [Roseibium sp.]